MSLSRFIVNVTIICLLMLPIYNSMIFYSVSTLTLPRYQIQISVYYVCDVYDIDYQYMYQVDNIFH